jgi:hypothetical protein
VIGATLALIACGPLSKTAPPSDGSSGSPAAAAERNLTDTAGDEPMQAHVDATNQFRFIHPASWAKSTPSGEAVRVSGRDQFMSVAVVSTGQPVLDFAATDAQQLATASQGYSSTGPKSSKVAGAPGALVQYRFEGPPSPVTGKPVPSQAYRYYIPGPSGKVAVFTYASAVNTFDREDAEDFANAFQWLS